MKEVFQKSVAVSVFQVHKYFLTLYFDLPFSALGSFIFSKPELYFTHFVVKNSGPLCVNQAVPMRLEGCFQP